ncbi:hypothetical protein BJF79_36035 [Actinomadura sp. CNU-125]|uniref:hypothetical protein n=1 Tax=Actinomadura sp. CNU-125 TaxID=1904961 RepID=UPI000965B71D|nr:hypothetical protein [Actinomadura sp. CNU-125]OLT32474.1 hypothetical protein BJF79_36035 [Actinomadura sp. CNU-125]
MSRRSPGSLRAPRYGKHPERSRRVPDGISAKVLREITEASAAGRCPSVTSMNGALDDLKAFLRRPGRTLQVGTCPCCDPGYAAEVLDRVARSLSRSSRREVEKVTTPLIERYRDRTLNEPSAPADRPWWDRRISGP